MRSLLLRHSLALALLVTSCAHAQSDRGSSTVQGALPICNNHVLAIGADDVDVQNIPAEFGGIDAHRFQAMLRQQLNASALNTVFPNARFFSRSFEHRAVAYLYDRVVLQADVSALSFLIRLSESTQTQIRTDSLSALAFIHFQMASNADKQRGLELIQTAIKGLNSYPAVVFWGRAHVWGDSYAEKNLNTAMNFLAAAGRIPGERKQQNNRMDPLNTEEVHTLTLKHLIENVPEMPFRSSYEPVYAQGMAIMRLQEDFKLQYPKTSEFNPVAQALQELEALLHAPALAEAFDVPHSKSSAEGWEQLNRALSHQEQLAQRVHGATALNAAQKELLNKLEPLNQKLQTALMQSQRVLISQLMGSKEEFPRNIKALKSLTAVDHGLSRSCSLSATWQLHTR